MGFFIIQFIISFFVLIAIHATWWTWLFYASSVLLWLIIGALKDEETNGNTANNPQQEHPCTED